MAEMVTPVDQLGYEQALSELEEILARLETSQASLEESMALYERGQELVKRCADLLDQAELKVRILTADADAALTREEEA
jgi:exodeoxyribonuclease VII small subunit